MGLFKDRQKQAAKAEIEKRTQKFEEEMKTAEMHGIQEQIKMLFLRNNIDFTETLALISEKEAESYRERIREAFYGCQQIENSIAVQREAYIDGMISDLKDAGMDLLSQEDRAKLDAMDKEIASLTKEYNVLVEKHINSDSENRWNTFLQMKEKERDLNSLKAEQGDFYMQAVIRARSEASLKEKPGVVADKKENQCMTMEEIMAEIEKKKREEHAQRQSEKNGHTHLTQAQEEEPEHTK